LFIKRTYQGPDEECFRLDYVRSKRITVYHNPIDHPFGFVVLHPKKAGDIDKLLYVDICTSDGK